MEPWALALLTWVAWLLGYAAGVIVGRDTADRPTAPPEQPEPHGPLPFHPAPPPFPTAPPRCR